MRSWGQSGSVMGGEERRRSGTVGARMLLLRAEGCLLCLALDAVVGVFSSDDESRRGTAPIVDWTSVSGIGRRESAPTSGGSLVLVRTDSRIVGLRVDGCLGVRDVSFLESPPIPTRLLEKEGRPVCYLLMVDRQPHFLIEPHALARAADEQPPTAPATEIASITPQAVGG